MTSPQMWKGVLSLKPLGQTSRGYWHNLCPNPCHKCEEGIGQNRHSFNWGKQYMNRFDTGDIAVDVVAAYSEGGNMNDYEREAAKIALMRSSGQKPQQAYAIAIGFLSQMLSKAEQDYRGEMMDLARLYPIKETPEGRQITREWE